MRNKRRETMALSRDRSSAPLYGAGVSYTDRRYDASSSSSFSFSMRVNLGDVGDPHSAREGFANALRDETASPRSCHCPTRRIRFAGPSRSLPPTHCVSPNETREPNARGLLWTRRASNDEEHRSYEPILQEEKDSRARFIAGSLRNKDAYTRIPRSRWKSP